MPRGPIGPAALSEKASVRLTPGEKAKLTRDRAAMSESEYIRRLIVRGGIEQINKVAPPPAPSPSMIPPDISADLVLDPPPAAQTPLADRVGSRKVVG